MRTFYDCLEMVKEVERDLAEMGLEYQSYSVQDQVVKDDPDYVTKELTVYGYILYPQNNEFKNAKPMVAYKQNGNYINWVYAEAIDRLNLLLTFKNPGRAWIENEQFWSPFLRDDRFSYTYAERWQEQLSYIINELSLHPNTRQAVMTMYDRHQDMLNWGGRDRVPCSLTYHFLLRRNLLHLIYNQRSCDFKKFFSADVYCTLQLLEYVAKELNVKIGSFTHIINSLHVFKQDVEGVF